MFPITKQGEEKIRKELERLRREERPKIVNAIAEARAHGDLKENAEYHAAKEQQGMVEARVRDLEHKLAHAQLIDVTRLPNEGKVIFGATVTLNNFNDDKKVTYQIVGEDEANHKHGKISVRSPIARGLIGKFEGDTVEIITPSGEIEYEVVTVEYV